MNALSYKWYNADQLVGDKTMKEHLRFSVCFWHTFLGTGADPFGPGTATRTWPTSFPLDNYDECLKLCKQRVDAAFEFFTKLGVPYYCFHDRDVAPEMKTIEESNKLLEAVTDYMKEKQTATGMKLLWGTACLFKNKRYMYGAATNPDLAVFAHAAAQVKKTMEVSVKLGAENFVFWGGREGFSSALNTNCRKELDHAAAFFKMASDYKKKLGSSMTLLIEPKPKEPMKHQYDYDAMTTIAFLKQYGLDTEYKLNIEPNHTQLAGHGYAHDIMMATDFEMLGSIDANAGLEDLGWDTDCYTTDVKHSTEVMRYLLRSGGLKTGGLNFDCKVRRESTDLEDMFIATIASMDTWAKGLLTAHKIKEEGTMDGILKRRYESWDADLGQEVEAGNCSFETLEKYAMKTGEPKQASGKQELYEATFNQAIWTLTEPVPKRRKLAGEGSTK